MAQPNMGQRKLYVTRLPETVAVHFDAETVASGMPHSQFIADLLATKYGLVRPSERFVTKRATLASRMQATLNLDLSSAPVPHPDDAGAPAPHPVSPEQAETVFRTYSTRLPTDIAKKVEAEATELGMSYSHFIAALLAGRYGAQLPHDRFASKRTATDQEVLPLVRAS